MLTVEEMGAATEKHMASIRGLLAATISHGFHGRMFESAMVTLMNLPIAAFNIATLIDVQEGQEPELIAGVADFFKDKEIPWSWLLSESTRPDTFADSLLNSGYQFVSKSPGMYIDLAKYNRSGTLECVREIESDSTQTFVDLLLEIFQMPEAAGISLSQVLRDFKDNRSFIVWSDGKPVATSTVFYVDGVAGIYNVGTLESQRRRGFGELAMHGCLSAAQDDGYDYAVLQSSRAGQPLYERLGFEVCRNLSYYALAHR